MGQDVLTYVMLGVLLLVVIFMFRNSKKRQRDAQKLHEQIVVGAEVMTTFGLFGTIVEIDSEQNKITLTTDGTSTMTVHRQAIARVVEDDVSLDPEDEPEAGLSESDGDPEFGERIDADDERSTDN